MESKDFAQEQVQARLVSHALQGLLYAGLFIFIFGLLHLCKFNIYDPIDYWLTLFEQLGVRSNLVFEKIKGALKKVRV